MTSFIAAGGSGRSTSVIPAVPAASSVTTIAFIRDLPVAGPFMPPADGPIATIPRAWPSPSELSTPTNLSRVETRAVTADCCFRLDPTAPDFYPDWERLAFDLVATLRSHAGRNPYDRALQDLIGELSTRSDESRVRWAAHNVRFHRRGVKRHPIVGELELSYETMTIDADDGLGMALYAAEPGSAPQQALDLLASWAAAPEVAERRLAAPCAGRSKCQPRGPPQSVGPGWLR